MVCIRLMRMGAKKRPYYRVVVADSRRFRDGKFIEKLGFYDPLPEAPRVELNMERVDFWMQKGAQPSETVRSLISGIRKAPSQVS
jgi:small subunit ribosomal protein S16